jgi:hypothetical protein
MAGEDVETRGGEVARRRMTIGNKERSACILLVYFICVCMFACLYAESISFSLNGGGGGGETFFFPFLTKRLATVIDPMIDHFRDTFANTRNFTHLLSFYRFA